jgi:hypothetical protein
VLDSLINIPKKFSTFIDLGSADGYYGIGVLINNLFQNSICYEISEQGRKTIKDNASLNNVINRVDIRGVAKKNFEAFNNSIIFIELHEWFISDGNEKIKKLINDSNSTHKTTKIKMGSRDLSIFPELKMLHDNDRWLICSEGRQQLMTWLRFDPK